MTKDMVRFGLEIESVNIKIAANEKSTDELKKLYQRLKEDKEESLNNNEELI